MTDFNGDEISFEVNGITLAAKQWGNREGSPVIALHGWLDNSASFDILAPALKNIHLLAIDMAGHGLSESRSINASYNIWSDLPEIFSIANQMKWPTFSLIAHSRGAIVAEIAAGTFPDRIEKLVLIDTIGLQPQEPDQAPKQLAQAVLKKLDANRSPRFYKTKQEAIKSRTHSAIPLGQEASQSLAARGVRLSEQGYYWHAAPELKHPSEFKMSSTQFNAFLQQIKCPVLLCLGDAGLKKDQRRISEVQELIGDCRIIDFPGGHHLHMEASALPIAKAINDFFGDDTIA